MNKRSFIESVGGTCKNWRWSWSYINVKEKKIIFGAWDKNTESTKTLILDEKRDNKGKKTIPPGFNEAREYIELVETGEYSLWTFPMEYSNTIDKNGNTKAKIKSFEPHLSQKNLIKSNSCWYAVDKYETVLLPEEVVEHEIYPEGAVKNIWVNSFERNFKARAKCIEYYGTKCFVCKFDFEEKYGDIGKGLIHVHHINPLASIRAEYEIDPIKDLRPICPNCHMIIHSRKPIYSIEEMIESLRKKDG